MKIGNKLVFGYLAIILLMAAAVGISLKHIGRVAEPLNKEMPARIREISKVAHQYTLAQLIRYYDEILTQSARNYAFTQDIKWKNRYKDAEPELDKIIKETISKGDKKDRSFFSGIDAANIALVKMEYRSIELVDQGQPNEAVKILEGKEYWDQKNIYAEGLRGYVEMRGLKKDEALLASDRALGLEADKARKLLNASIQLAVVFVMLALLLSALIALFVSGSILKPIASLREAAINVSGGNLEVRPGVESRDEVGEFSRVFYMMTDSLKRSTTSIDNLNKEISERKKAEEATRMLALIVESSADAIIGKTPDGVITSWNQGAEHLYGYKDEEIIGKPISILVPKDRPNEISSILERIKKGEKIDHYETVRKRKDGTLIDISFTISALRDDQGRIIGASSIARDITLRKKAEEELKQAVKMKSDFTSMVAHELRTPLGPIKEGVCIILDGLTGAINDSQRDLLDTVRRNADRLGRLIGNVLDFQKLESGMMPFFMQEEDISEVIHEIYKTMSLVTKRKGLDLIMKIEPGLPKIRFDKDKILQVMTNLVGNSVKFTETGSIGIQARKEGNVIHVIVQDTGPGIKREDIPKLFQSFQQLDTTRDKKIGGTGLGLAISKEIIMRHNGKIWAESEFGKGAAFHFLLPIQERRA